MARQICPLQKSQCGAEKSTGIRNLFHILPLAGVVIWFPKPIGAFNIY